MWGGGREERGNGEGVEEGGSSTQLEHHHGPLECTYTDRIHDTHIDMHSHMQYTYKQTHTYLGTHKVHTSGHANGHALFSVSILHPHSYG